MTTQTLPELGARYRFIERLGEGGVGSVLLVEDTTSSERVALKVLAGAADEATLLRFKQEFRLAASLRHPNLCAMREFGRLPGGEPFLTMEHVPGRNLDEAVPPDAESVVALVGQLARGLACLHHAGFVHCDVKPENVRVTPDGVVKLLDFGLMEHANQQVASIKGTLAYVSPEVAKRGRVDQRSDFYSLGVVLYQLLTGTLPLRGETPLELLKAHLNTIPRPARELRHDLSEGISRALARLLAKEPSARPQSAVELLESLGLDAEVEGSQGLFAPPFVGRVEAFAALDAAVARLVETGQGGHVSLSGQAGSGKTRLLDELRVHVQLLQRPYVASSVGSHSELPYGAWVGVLRALVPLAIERCPEVLAEVGPVLAPLIPGLDAHERVTLEPDLEKLAIQRAITGLLMGAARGGVVVLEHWDRADALSREAFEYLLRNAPTRERGEGLEVLPVLLVTSGQAPTPLGEPVALAGLGRLEVRQLLVGVLGQAALPDSLVAQLAELSDGLPGPLLACVEHAVATGHFARQKDGWQLPERLAQTELALDLQRMLAERLAGLTSPALALAGAVAVLEPGFGLGLAVAVCEGIEEQVLDGISELVRSRLLEVAGGGYRYSSAALREHLMAGLGPDELASCHARAARWLEAEGPASEGSLERLVTIARHYLAAGLALEALPLALEAGTRLADLWDNQAAEAMFQGGLALAEREPARWRAERARFQVAIARVGRMRFEVGGGIARIEEALALAEELGEPALRLEVLVERGMLYFLRRNPADQAIALASTEAAIALARELGNLRVAARALLNLGRSRVLMGDGERGKPSLEEAIRAAQAGGFEFFEARGVALLGWELSKATETREEGLRHLGQACAIQERIGDRFGLGYSQNLLADALMDVGRLAEALEVSKSLVVLMRELGSSEDEACAIANQLLIHLERGEVLEGLALAPRVEVLARAVAGSIATPAALSGIALANALAGRLAYAEALVVEADTAGRSAGSVAFSYALPCCLEALMWLGQSSRARELAQEGVFAFRSEPNPRGEMAVAATLSELYADEGRWEQAAQQAQQARKLALAADARHTLVKALRLEAVAALGQGRHGEARALADQAQALATKLGMRLQQILMAELYGELALAEGRLEVMSFFQTMQALADQADVPLLRARALAGQVKAAPGAASAPGLLAEAQAVVRELASRLEGPARASFLAHRQNAAILERHAAVRVVAAATPDGSRQIGERFRRMSDDLQGLVGQYDAMYQDWQASNDQLRKLNELTSRMGESLRLDEVLQQVLALTLEITKAERGFVVLQSGGRYGDLVGRAALDQFGQVLPSDSFSLSVVRKVLSSGKAIAILDASSDQDFQAAHSIVALDIQTVMGVPLIAKGKTLGVLYVDSQAVVTTFTEKDLELMRAIAGHAGGAIENAVLYEALDARASELEEALARFREAEAAANTDVLTGLPNRRNFREQGVREFAAARRYGRSACLVMLDVDHFKKFNDSYGHALGDEVLKAVGKALVACVRDVDLPARLGGEEFVVLCPNTDPTGAQLVAERIRQAVSEIALLDAEGQAVRQITASLGIAELALDDDTLDTVLERADVALYACKHHGRNQVQTWHAGMAAAQPG